MSSCREHQGCGMVDGPRVAVLASGRGSNFEALLRAFSAGDVPGRIVLFVTDRAKARAKTLAEENCVPAIVLRKRKRTREDYDRSLVDLLREHEVDYVLLAGFMRILGPIVVDVFWGKILNIHPSLLPAFPGLHAQTQALAAGVAESGCTVHFVDHGMDTGPIVLQRRVPVFPGDEEDDLAARILVQEHEAYPEAARLVLSGRVHLAGNELVRESDLPLPKMTAFERSGSARTPAM